MTRRLPLLLLLAASLASALPGFAEAAGPEEEKAMAATQAACDAFRLRDLAALERLLAPGFTLVGSTSEVYSREQNLEEVRQGEPKYEVFRNHGMEAHLFGAKGDAAIVWGITSLKGTSGGTPFEFDVRFTDTLVKKDGAWRLLASHVTRIPKP
jgi:ketosteroid isomerase-like protein